MKFWHKNNSLLSFWNNIFCVQCLQSPITVPLRKKILLMHIQLGMFSVNCIWNSKVACCWTGVWRFKLLMKSNATLSIPTKTIVIIIINLIAYFCAISNLFCQFLPFLQLSWRIYWIKRPKSSNYLNTGAILLEDDPFKDTWTFKNLNIIKHLTININITLKC